MSPEVLCAQNHSFPADFFAIGVMGFEFMLGERPYMGKSRKEIQQEVLSRQILVTHDDLPEGWSRESASFINGLLQRKPQKRLGSVSGISDLKNHRWFKDFDWDGLYNKTIPSPFIPKSSGNYDKKYCEGVEKINTETKDIYQLIMQRDDYVSLFNSYTYINTEEKNMIINQYREKAIENQAISPSGNLRTSKETPLSFTRNNSLLFKTKSNFKTPLFLNRNNSNFCDAKYLTRKPNQRNASDFLPNTENHAKTLFKPPNNLAMRNKNFKTIRIFKRLEGSHSCKLINSQLPVININQANVNIVQYPLNNNNNNNNNESNNAIFNTIKRKKKKIIIPINLDNNNHLICYKTLHKSESGKLNIHSN